MLDGKLSSPDKFRKLLKLNILKIFKTQIEITLVVLSESFQLHVLQG